MPGVVGNENNRKFKTQEERQTAFKVLIEHLEQGYNQDSFPICDWETIEWYIDNFSMDFDSEKIREARRKGMKHWEGVGYEGLHKPKDFSAIAWIFIMKNKYSDLWSDMKEVQLGNKKGEVFKQDVRKVTDEELDEALDQVIKD